MRRFFLGLAGAGVLGAPVAWGQTHAVKKPETVVRAVAVYEWTGEEDKPTASRVVPVSLFINGQLQDAAVYLTQPVPFALDTGTIYEARKAGVPEGTLEIKYERHLTSGDTAEIDDGWLGYGAFKPKPKEVARKQSGPLPKLVASGGSGPRFASRTPAAAGDAGTDKTEKSDDTDAANSNRPSFHKRPAGTDDSGTSGTVASTKSTDTSTDPDDPADRPTLKRRSPAEMKAAQKKNDQAKVVGGGNLNDDPDRPVLHRGSKTSTDEEEIPPLRGLPKDMHQMVAVSDAKDRPEHEFAREWESEDERRQVLAKMQELARTQLAGYTGAGTVAAAPAPSAPAPSAPAPSAPAPSASAPSSRTASSPGQTASSGHAAAARGTAASRARKKAAAAPSAPAPLPLTEESLQGYTLSYGGAATYVYSATSAGVGGVSRYVTVVAQEEPITGLKLALGSVTDSSHLDRTPWMRLVDVVDADASNRASLLFELRAQHTRQFALYRVIGAEASQVFLTGTTE
jgi:hypothetical protein